MFRAIRFYCRFARAAAPCACPMWSRIRWTTSDPCGPISARRAAACRRTRSSSAARRYRPARSGRPRRAAAPLRHAMEESHGHDAVRILHRMHGRSYFASGSLAGLRLRGPQPAIKSPTRFLTSGVSNFGICSACQSWAAGPDLSCASRGARPRPALLSGMNLSALLSCTTIARESVGFLAHRRGADHASE